MNRRCMRGAALVLLLLVAVSCGDGSSPVQPSSAVQVKVGDAAADRVVAFELTLTSLALTTSNGQQVAIMEAPRRVEFTRLAGTLEPVAALDIPQGTYTDAAITGSNLHISYIDATGAIHEYTSGGQFVSQQTLDPQLVVGGSSVLDVDLDLGASITRVDPSNVQPPQFEPVYTFSVAPVTATQQTEEEGALQHVIGLVTAADSGSFTMLMGQNGMPLTFGVDVSTAFQDVTLTTLPNMIVEVDGVTAADGTLYAERVAGLTNSTGAVVEGMLMSNAVLPDAQAYTPRRASIPKLVVQDGVGNGMRNALVGTPVTVDFTNASYGVNGEGMPDGWAFNLIGGLVFNPETMIPGQAVQVVTTTGITPIAGGFTIPARTVTLQEQAATGVVSDYREVSVFLSVDTVSAKSVSPSSALSMPVHAFDLQLPEDSYLRLLTPFTSVTVGVFPETRINGASAISNSMNVRVRGWLFYFSDELAMIADRIDYINTPVLAGARTTVPRR
ncbi:MAG TPA: DUF5666 domain-containing protein [Terriglobales bacterium]|nr:DUF5666 domain-containing protein [Terriglobales bacterium]